jgi:hypothetical protein
LRNFSSLIVLRRSTETFPSWCVAAVSPHSQRNAGADTTHQTDQIFRVLSVPADGTSAAKQKKRGLRYVPVLWATLGQASSACLYIRTWGRGTPPSLAWNTEPWDDPTGTERLVGVRSIYGSTRLLERTLKRRLGSFVINIWR